MALTVDSVLDEIFEIYPGVDEEFADIATATSDIQEIGDVQREEDKTIYVGSKSSIGSLLQPEDEDTTRISRCIPALNLKRCASFEDLDWLDSFLWLASEVYREQKPTPIQKILVNIFLAELQSREDYHEPLLDALQEFPGGIDQFGIVDPESFSTFMDTGDDIAKATVVAYAFGYDLHIFSFKTKDFLNPTYISKGLPQTNRPAMFMIQTVDGHIEPLFELGESTFADKFSWDDSVLCAVKEVCNKVGGVAFTRPSDEGCSSIPTGTSLDTLDEWVKSRFPTWVEESEQAPIQDKHYILPQLSTTIRTKKNGKFVQQPLPIFQQIQTRIQQNKWWTAKTIGDGTCLIHSLLQCLSSAYRSVPQESRSLVGEWYRRDAIVPLYIPAPLDIRNTNTEQQIGQKQFEHEVEEENYKRMHTVQAWLTETDLTFFIQLFQINIVVIESQSRNYSIFQPDSGFSGKPFIFILNSGQSHYSSIYLSKQGKFMLSEDEMRDLYPEMYQILAQDTGFTAVRKQLVDFVRSTEAEEATKNMVVTNVFRHVYTRPSEPDPAEPDKPGRNLEGKLNTYADTLGISPRNLNRFRQTLRNATRGGRRRNKTRSKV